MYLMYLLFSSFEFNCYVISTTLKESANKRVTLSLPNGMEIKDFTYLAAGRERNGSMEVTMHFELAHC